MPENHDNSVINAVKRLDRLGDEYSGATKKLQEAVAETFWMIYDVSLGNGGSVRYMKLPMGYHISKDSDRDISLRNDMGYTVILANAVSRIILKYRDLGVLYKFAQDIHDGFLTQLANITESDLHKSQLAYNQIKNSLRKQGVVS